MKTKPHNRGTVHLWGGTALTMDAKGTVLENALITIVDGLITKVTSQKRPSKPNSGKSIDCRGCLVMPGLVNGHTHTGMTLLRGVADDLPLHDWLEKAVFPLEKKWGNKEFVYWGTLLAAAEMISCGTTLFNDMYYFEESAAKAVNEVGMRCIAGQTIILISGVEKEDEILGSFDSYLEQVAKYPLVIPAIAPHSVYGVTKELWPEIIRYARERNLPIHVHLSESETEVAECRKRFGKSPTKVFNDLGLWEGPSIAAHVVLVDEEDKAILGGHHVGIAHNPESNLKLENKICPVVELRAAGCPVSLGTDGVASNNNLDLLQEADIASKLQIFRVGSGKLTTFDVVKMLTIEGATALGLGDKTGSLEVGKWGDVIAVNVNRFHAQPLYNPYSHLVYSASGSDVQHVICNGAILMENRRLKTIDADDILKEAKRWGKKIQPGPFSR